MAMVDGRPVIPGEILFESDSDGDEFAEDFVGVDNIEDWCLTCFVGGIGERLWVVNECSSVIDNRAIVYEPSAEDWARYSRTRLGAVQKHAEHLRETGEQHLRNAAWLEALIAKWHGGPTPPTATPDSPRTPPPPAGT